MAKPKRKVVKKKVSKQIWWWKFMISRARQVMKWSPLRRQCLTDAKGFCAGCKTGGHLSLAADHIDPVVPVTAPFAGDWNTYFDRMFNGKLQALCKGCHDKKTADERKKRKSFKTLTIDDIERAVSKLSPIQDIKVPIVFPNALGVTAEDLDNWASKAPAGSIFVLKEDNSSKE